jgi:hypothetical protein
MKKALLVGLVAAAAACIWAFTWRAAAIGGLPLLDGQFFGYTAAEGSAMLSALSEDSRHLYQWTALTLDMAFPLIYASLFVLVFRALFPNSPGLRLLPVTAAIADAAENLLVAWMIAIHPDVSHPLSAIAALLTLAKWLAVWATLGATAWGVLRYLATPTAPDDGAYVRTIHEVLEHELEYVRGRRRHSGSAGDDPRETLVGLSLSGGGIRSATSCLGMLQALSRLGILPLVDYVSTVSGGGYIGACLTSVLTLRRPNGTPYFSTRWEDFPFNPDHKEGRSQIDHLRTHGSFLITRTGLLARETLRSIGQLLSGVLYHLGIALLALSIATLGYMALLLTTAPELHDTLFQETARPYIVDDPAYRMAKPDEQERNVFRQATLTEHLLDKFSRLRNAVDNAIANPRARDAIAGAMIYGTALALAAFVYLLLSYKQEGRPVAGESVYDARERTLLRRVGFGGLGATIVLFVWAWKICPKPGGVIWLFIPALGLATALATSFFLHLLLPRLDAVQAWNRRVRSLWGAFQALAWYAFLTALALALFPLASYAVREYVGTVGISSVAALVVARVMTARAARGTTRWALPTGLRHFILGVAVAAGVLLALVAISASVIPDERADVAIAAGAFLRASLIGLVAFLTLGWMVDANRVSPHYFYQDRLGETYLYTEERRGDILVTTRNDTRLRLKDLLTEAAPPTDGSSAGTAPYHLVSAAINLASSRDLTRKDRKSGYFLFSKYFCGSTHTGFIRTDKYQGGHTKLARVMTISGAAASSGIGVGTFFAQAFATVLFNLRLGYWMPSPSSPISRKAGERWYFWPRWLVREMFMRTSERSVLVNLSDGGHTGDNVGIYPLLQRRCRVIIACDAEQDSDVAFGSLTEALRHAYIDLGIDVDIDFTMLRRDPTTGMSRSHCAVGLIRYPGVSPTRPPNALRTADEADDRQPPMIGYLIYLKNSLTGDEPEPVLNYKSAHPAFPHESTIDQFFDDAQFESYRALGVHIVEQSLAAWTDEPEFRAFRDRYWPY